ncbi:hypothetical protein EZS27_032184 [termite gut metagenome]|uniref:CD-NTase-associated protein 12/Pycsar effector protein TIR domain-containing protein n=1 Tax=termite gut metagenome TaxID=433724 RepID=A0A5J4Q903_9ZZZZ
MATSKKINQSQIVKPVDALIVDKASFTAILLERIELGKELFNRQVTNIPELELNEKDYHRWDSYNFEYLKNSFNNENNDYKSNYDRINLSFIWRDETADANTKLRYLKNKIQNKIDNLESLVDKVELIKSGIENVIHKATNTITSDNNSIFIVHGHNTAIQQTVARTIEKLGLNPIILHEQANAGKTIIEKFEANSM